VFWMQLLTEYIFQKFSFYRLGLTQKRSPNPLKKRAFKIPPFLRGVRGDQGSGTVSA
jgi:hypothetical protein